MSNSYDLILRESWSLTGYPVDLSSKRRSCGSNPSRRVIGRSKAGRRQNLSAVAQHTRRVSSAPRLRVYSTGRAELLTSDITPSESLEYDAETG